MESRCSLFQRLNERLQAQLRTSEGLLEAIGVLALEALGVLEKGSRSLVRQGVNAIVISLTNVRYVGEHAGNDGHFPAAR